MKGDPLKLKEFCPWWDECLGNFIEEYECGDVKNAEVDMAHQKCCGCVVCVLFRREVGCDDECHEQKHSRH